MTRRSSRNRRTEYEEISPNVENLNLGEALRQARERANLERNRVKCKRYYRKMLKKKKGIDIN